MANIRKRVTAIGLIIAMVLQISHLENYRGAWEVLAASMETATDSTEADWEEDSFQSDVQEADGYEAEQQEVEQEGEEQEEKQDDILQSETIEENQELQQSEKEVDDGIDWQEFAVSGGVIEGDYSNREAIKLMGDIRITGDLSISNPINLNGHALIVEGALAQSDNLTVNGDLIVNGDYVWRKGDITFENGYMQVGGNLQVESQFEHELSMVHEEDYIFVEGDFLLGEYNRLSTNITDGTLELKGDFIQKVVTSWYDIDYPQSDFYAGGNSVLILSGEGRQNIYVAKETSGFRNIAVSTSNLETDENGQYLFGDRQIGFSGLCNYEKYEDCGCPTTYGYAAYDRIEPDCGIIYGSCYYTGEPLHLNGNSLRVVGDFIQNGDLYSEGGNLYIYGDYRIQSVNGSGGYGETAGKLVVQKGCSICVHGDFVTESVTDHTGLLTNGFWYLYGNLYQLGKTAKNFVTSDDLKIYLQNKDSKKARECHIAMDNPLDNPLAYLYGPSSEIKVAVDKGVYITGYSSFGTYSGYVIVKDVNVSSDYGGDVRIMSDAQINKNLWVRGNVTIEADTRIISTMQVTGNVEIGADVNIIGSMQVTGNVTIGADVNVAGSVRVSKDMIMKKGTLTVDGGYVSADVLSFQDGSDSALVMEKDGSSLYCGDFYYGSNRESGKLTNGNLQFARDFYVKDTGTSNNFVCSGSHRVTAYGSGNGKHITIESPDSNIETLYVSSADSVRATDGTVIHTVIDSSGTYVWEGIEGYTLDRDETYDEDVFLTSGTLDLNGHTLTVNGDLYAEQGTIYIHGGNLIVNGDLKFVFRDWQSGKPQVRDSKADLVMSHKEDRVDINGSWYCVFQSGSLGKMQRGDVYLSGNVMLNGTMSASPSASKNMMDGSNLHLTGDTKQTITGDTLSFLLKTGDFIAENGQEIEVKIPMQVGGILRLPENYRFYKLTVQNLGNIDGHYFKGDIEAVQSQLTGDIQIEGSLNIKGLTDFCGYSIHAGNVTVNAETYLSGGGLYADELYINNKIYMQNPEDVIRTGDVYINVRTSDSDYMTDGNIYITGNFTDDTDKYYSFLPSGSHAVVFDVPGDSTADITFNNGKSKLNRAVFNNRISNYTINRERKDIANELIIGYDDKEKPAPPQSVGYKSVLSFMVHLQWSEATDNMEIDYYKLYRDGECICETEETQYIDVVLRPRTTYNYSVSAVDVAGNESEQSKVEQITTSGDGQAPVLLKTPSIKVDEDKLTMACKGAFVDRQNYVDYYVLTKDGEEVARLIDNASVAYLDLNGKYVSLQVREGDPVYTEEGLEYGQLHEYCLYAVDAAGNTSEGCVMNVVANYPPDMAKGFSVISESGYNIISVQRSGTAECESYRVYRDGKWVGSIKNSGEGTGMYIDTEVELGSSYTYCIRPCNMYGTLGEPTEECEIQTVGENVSPVIEEVRSSIPGNIINENVQLQVRATDKGGLKEIRAYIVKSGEEEQKVVCEQKAYAVEDSLTAEFGINTEKLLGVYDLHIVAVDYSDNETEQIITYKINIDGLKPVKVVKKRTAETEIFLEWEAAEGADYYAVEYKKQGSYSYTQISGITKTNCSINNLRDGMEYQCRIVAYDKDGVRGLATEDIVLTTKNDTDAPKITKVYAGSSVLALDTFLEVGYQDNIEVNKVRAYYRISGENNWTLINEEEVDKKSGSVQLAWNKEGLESGVYEVCYQAEDRNGNLSREVIESYQLDLDGPVIRNLVLTPEDWQIKLQWDAFVEEDYTRYEIGRIRAAEYDAAVSEGKNDLRNVLKIASGKDLQTYEEMISPSEEYVYILYAYDKYGNVTTASVRGRSIDHDIFPPTVASLSPIFGAADVAISLSAAGCTDNDEVAYYEWDMGNGDVVQGMDCEYVYREPGTYNLTLTAEDRSGNRTSKTTTVTVGKDTGMVQVIVVCGSKRVQGADVVACVNGKACHSGEKTKTNSQGILSFPMAAGTYRFAAYKEGYIPKELPV
ncbi:MAG: PKD domain-containing protein [Clostridium sp.]|nr:PKD domain-containing protein [Clostridium sp.]